MAPALRVFCLSLLLVHLVLQSESLLASSMGKERRAPNICSPGQDGCQKACPVGWMFYNDNCYGFFEENLTWSAAEVMCQSAKRTAHLASFLNQKELEEISKYISSIYDSSQHVWIGLHDPRETGNWRWVDLSIPSYLPWDRKEPNNFGGQEHCAHLAVHEKYEKLNDASCTLELPYICKYSL